MKRPDFDELIRLMENPTRRKILELLCREDQYPLQISKTLDTSQQAISKHLKTMEKEGIVVSKTSKSKYGGPPTKTYKVNTEFSMRIDMGPTLFKTEVEDIEVEKIGEYEYLGDEVGKEDDEDYLLDKRNALDEIEEELETLEKKRNYLIKLKERALRKAYDHIQKNFEEYRLRYILYYVMESGETDPKKIAKKFDIREDEVENIIDRLKDKVKIW